MSAFFNDSLLLYNESAKKLYHEVKDLPIIDYHCHLDQTKIAQNSSFADIGELWLAGDHYKWRAMRLNGVDEYYITGNASYKEKFLKYAEIVPNLIGNALYYWTHLELKQIFGIDMPLNASTAERIYELANQKLKDLTVQELLKSFKVEFIATTDDPVDGLLDHKNYGDLKVTPTFRPDKLFAFEREYIAKLADSANMQICSLTDLLTALSCRLDYFVQKGCRMADHGMEQFPLGYATKEEAEALFNKIGGLNQEEKERLKGFILVWLCKQYAKRDITVQLHFAVTRNVNPQTFGVCGPDSGFDVISELPTVSNLIEFFNKIPDEERPQTVIYTLNDGNLSSIACLTGAFRKVRMGAAWWFNDTVEGIRRNLKIISEYSSLGNNLGMLTDSRSFSSYCRFDFFRRILCDYVGNLVEKGEYDGESAVELVKNICYYNAKRMVE
ncbi:MAG: glucuronate isomerase [Clostridiales bacterium]|nr:glucuronate isomerase [Clostridiales bacterium]